MREEKRVIGKEKREKRKELLVKSEEKRDKSEENPLPFTLNSLLFTLNSLLFALYSLLFALYSLPFTLFGEVATAPLNDIPGTAHVVTNVVLPDVAAIVTNTVEGGWSEWEFRCDVPEIQAALDANPPIVHIERYPTGIWAYALWGLPSVDGWFLDDTFGFGHFDSPNEASFSSDSRLYTKSNNEGAVVIATRERLPGSNALGLAMAKDTVSASVVTNIVRDNIGTIWDSSLGVAWQARMHNGHLYYIAVTNQPPEVK